MPPGIGCGVRGSPRVPTINAQKENPEICGRGAVGVRKLSDSEC